MAEYMHLVGAEQVQNAASTMIVAADNMKRAASEISWAFENHQRFLTGWLDQLQTILEAQKEKPNAPGSHEGN